MSLLQVLVLSIIQGAAELLPVSSSAHVIVAEKMMGLDPTSPEMTLLLVMLHTGTMFAVIVYFWQAWRAAYFSSLAAFLWAVILVGAATAFTGVVGLGLQWALKHFLAHGDKNFEIESLFGNAKLMAGALAAAGLVIAGSSFFPEKTRGGVTLVKAVLVGLVQGLCLPFRGFSRSGATISTGLALGVSRKRIEEFSFALAVALTPVVIGREALRLHKVHPEAFTVRAALPQLGPDLVGMVLSFAAGILALRWLSAWLEGGRWYWFGLYCLVFSGVVLWRG
jgi:undecaprenyl-diphosphatase